LTYGKIGEWRFNKRAYLSGPPPKNLSLPPPGVPETVVCPSLQFFCKENKVSVECASWQFEIDLTFCFGVL